MASDLMKTLLCDIWLEGPAKQESVYENEKKHDEKDDPEQLLIAENVLASRGGAKAKEVSEISPNEEQEQSSIASIPQLIEIHSIDDEFYRGNFGGASMKKLVKNLKKTDIKTRETPVYKDTYPLMDEMKKFSDFDSSAKPSFENYCKEKNILPHKLCEFKKLN